MATNTTTRLLLVLTGLCASLANAQVTCPNTLSGDVSATDPTQSNRLFRDGVGTTCLGEVSPGVFSASGLRYDKYVITNPGTALDCVTLTLSAPTVALPGYHMAAYTTFVATNPGTNYLADTGSSASSQGAQALSVKIPAGGQIELVIHNVAAGTYAAYSVATSACGTTPSTVALTSGANPTTFGQSLTLTANVTGAVTPTGVVTFYNGVTSLGTATLNGAGNASLTLSTLPVGIHSLTASYEGDGTIAAGVSPVFTQVINPAPTRTTVASSANPALVGASVTFTATVAVNSGSGGTPTGTVTFFDFGTTLGTGTLSGGIATLTTSTLTVGTHAISAVYGGATSFAGSTSSTLSQSINPDGATALVTSSVNPSTYGGSTTFTATVSSTGAGGLPTGSVTFSVDGNSLATVPLNASGVAVYSTAALPAGTSTLTATYGGDGTHGSAVATVSQVVNKAASMVAFTATPNPSVFGQPVSGTATVTGPGATTPSGTVTFFDGFDVVGSGTLNSSGQVTVSLALAVGDRSLTAVYGGNANYHGAPSSTLSHMVNKAGSSTVVSSSSNPSIVGSTVTLSAAVTARSPGGGAPSGMVTFYDMTTAIGTGSVNAGVATLDINTLVAGVHSITATYEGDANFLTSTSAPFAQTVSQDGVSAALVSSQTPSVYGSSVTFTATISSVGPGGFPTGMVAFKEGTSVLATATLDAAGVASFSTAALGAGTHSITVTYPGDANHAGSSATTSQVVLAAPTTTGLTSLANPSVFGQSVTFTATVAYGFAGAPTGSVTFKDGANPLGTATLNAGVATFATSNLSVATHPVTAEYEGDANSDESSSALVSQVVNKAATATVVASSNNPSPIGGIITFNATVTASAPGAGHPTGTVTFKAGTTVLGTGSVNGNGTAAFATTALAAGTYAITATYEGDTSFVTSVSAPVSQVVSMTAASIVLVSTPSPSPYGDTVTLSATISGNHGQPTGDVTFKVGTTEIATEPLVGGVVTVTVTTLPPGMHTLTAEYAGDTTYTGGVGSVAQVITKAASATAISSSVNPSSVGTSVTFTATVTSAVAGFTGTVELFDGATSLGTGALTGGTASVTTSALTAGDHVITAVFSGDTNFAGSTSTALTQQVEAVAVDAGTPVVDAGRPVVDAGVKVDAGSGGGTGGGRGGGAGGGTGGGSGGGGGTDGTQPCGCGVASSNVAMMALLGLALMLRRRRNA